MDRGNDFFGSVFDDPEDDPLLGGDGTAESGTDHGPESDPRENGVPSWMQDENLRENGKKNGTDTDGPKRKEIIVVQRGESQEGLDELNDAVEHGWRLVQLSLVQSGEGETVSGEGSPRFIAILEQESPQSLFDFGTP